MSARWESCCFALSDQTDPVTVVAAGIAWTHCTRVGGATGGGLGVLVVGGTFVQYAQPLANGSRPSFSRPTRGETQSGAGIES